MTLFASDNVTAASPEVMDAVLAANSGVAPSYGDDAWSDRLRERMSEVFEREVAVFPVVSGTVCNALCLSALCPPYGKVLCHELSHINTDECGAPEQFTGGAKLIPLAGENGKLTPAAVSGAIFGEGFVHYAQPAVLSLTQACETGTVYGLDEVAALAETARGRGLSVHMDGARFANALVSLDVSPAEMTWKAGVDVLSFGGTKNGCMAAEAVVFFDPGKVGGFPYLHKRAGQLLSKMRFISAQLIAYLEDGLWLRNARHANRMASRLGDGLAALPGVERAYPTQSNEVFVHLPRGMKTAFKEGGFSVNDEELDGSATRFVTAWNSDEEDIRRLLDMAGAAAERD